MSPVRSTAGFSVPSAVGYLPRTYETCDSSGVIDDGRITMLYRFLIFADWADGTLLLSPGALRGDSKVAGTDEWRFDLHDGMTIASVVSSAGGAKYIPVHTFNNNPYLKYVYTNVDDMDSALTLQHVPLAGVAFPTTRSTARVEPSMVPSTLRPQPSTLPAPAVTPVARSKVPSTDTLAPTPLSRGTVSSRKVTSRRATRIFSQVSPSALEHLEENTTGLTLTDDPRDLVREEAALKGLATKRPVISGVQPAGLNLSTRRIARVDIDFHGPWAPDQQGVIGFWSYTPRTGDMATIQPVRVKDYDTLEYGLQQFFIRVGTPDVIKIDRDSSAVAGQPAHVTRFEKFCSDHSIRLYTAPTDEHSENGAAERAGSTIYGHATAAATLAHQSPHHWSSYAANMVNYSFNRVPIKALNWKTKYYITHGVDPYVGHLHTPFCPAFAVLDKKARGNVSQWKNRVKRCMFVGYPTDQRDGTYTLYDFATKSTFSTSHAYFDDDFDLVQKAPSGYGWTWKSDIFSDPNLISALELALPDTDRSESAPTCEPTHAALASISSSVTPDLPSMRCLRTGGIYYTQGDPADPSADRLHGCLPAGRARLRGAHLRAAPEADIGSPDVPDFGTVPAADDSVSTPAIPPSTPPPRRVWGDPSSRGYSPAMVPRSVQLRGSITPQSLPFFGRRDFDSPANFSANASVARLTSTTIDWRMALSSGQAGEVQSAVEAGVIDPCDYTQLGVELFGDPTFSPRASFASTVPSERPWAHAAALGFTHDPITTVDVPTTPPPVAPLSKLDGAKQRSDYFAVDTPTTWDAVPPINWDKTSRAYKDFAKLVGDTRAQAAYISENKGIYDAGAIMHVEQPLGVPILPSMEVYKTKNNGTDKGRTCILGSREIEGRDFSKFEVPAPVATNQSQRMQDIIAVKNAYPLRVIDVKLAFLGGKLQRLVLCSPPGGIDLGVGPNGRPIVWCLLLSLYGLVESPQIWYCAFSNWLLSQGYVRSPVDMACFVHGTSPDFRSINIHVDDSKLRFQLKEEEDKFAAALLAGPASHGGIHDLGYDFGECVGVEYTVTPNGYHLHLTKWLSRVADKLGLAEAKAKDVPLPARLHALPETPESIPLDAPQKEEFLTKVGIVQWASTTGVLPQMGFSASHLGTRRSAPLRYDLEMATRTIRFLLSLKGEGITLERSPALPDDMESEWACDSDWAGDKESFRSHGGYYGTWGGLPLISHAGRHKSMSTSSTSAEITQMSNTGMAIVVHRRAAGFMRHPPKRPALLRADNAAGITVAEQQIMLTAVARHIAVRYLYIRELVGHGVVTLRWISTTRNVADIFSKPLQKILFSAFDQVIRGRDLLWQYT
jgi:hypothetical protein